MTETSEAAAFAGIVEDIAALARKLAEQEQYKSASGPEALLALATHLDAIVASDQAGQRRVVRQGNALPRFEDLADARRFPINLRGPSLDRLLDACAREACEAGERAVEPLARKVIGDGEVEAGEIVLLHSWGLARTTGE